jgi:hypothetical protein
MTSTSLAEVVGSMLVLMMSTAGVLALLLFLVPNTRRHTVLALTLAMVVSLLLLVLSPR